LLIILALTGSRLYSCEPAPAPKYILLGAYGLALTMGALAVFAQAGSALLGIFSSRCYLMTAPTETWVGPCVGTAATNDSGRGLLRELMARGQA